MSSRCAAKRSSAPPAQAAARLACPTADAAAIEGYEERLTIAGINSPNSVTIADDADASRARRRTQNTSTFYRELGSTMPFTARPGSSARRAARPAGRTSRGRGNSGSFDDAPAETRRRAAGRGVLVGQYSQAGASRRRSRRWLRTGSTPFSKSARIRSSMAICANASGRAAAAARRSPRCGGGNRNTRRYGPRSAAVMAPGSRLILTSSIPRRPNSSRCPPIPGSASVTGSPTATLTRPCRHAREITRFSANGSQPRTRSGRTGSIL